MKGAVEHMLGKKGYRWTRDSERTRQTVRLFEAYIGTAMDVVDAMTCLPSTIGDAIHVSDLEHALAQLHHSRVLPDHAETVGKLLVGFLRAGGDAGRSAVLNELEAAGISCSERSYDRHIQTLAAFDLVSRTESGTWEATIVPWYATDGYTEIGVTQMHNAAITRTADVILEAIEDLPVDVPDHLYYEAFADPTEADRDLLADELGSIIEPWFGYLDALQKSATDAIGRFDENVVKLGPKTEQVSITSPGTVESAAD